MISMPTQRLTYKLDFSFSVATAGYGDLKKFWRKK